MRVLMLERPSSAATFGGEHLHLTRLVQELTVLGARVVHSTDPRLALESPFDIVHLWNLQHPGEALATLPVLQEAGVPLVLTPLYNDLRRSVFTHRAQEVLAGFEGRRLSRRANELSSGHLLVDGARRWQELEPLQALVSAQGKLLSAISGIFPLSQAESVAISTQIGPPPAVVEVAHVAADPPPPDPEPFRRATGLRGAFVLLPASRLEPGKNQWLTLRALRSLKVPVVVTGESSNPSYERLCRRDAPAATMFVGRLPRDLLHSAMAAATVVVHPSPIECASLAALEGAALCGRLVVGDTGSEGEYFGDLAWVVPPMDSGAARRAVQEALAGGEEVVTRQQALQVRARGMFSWRGSAEKVLTGYCSVLSRLKPAAEVASLPPIHFRGVVLGPSGFAAQGRDWLSCLDEQGFAPSLEGASLGHLEVALEPEDVRLIRRCAERPRREGAVTLHHMLPPHFEPDARAGLNVVQTLFETTSLPPGWGPALNRADAVVVPTEFNRRSFTAGGVDPRRLHVVPVPFRAAPYRSDASPPPGLERQGGLFRWLTICDWSTRKGIDLLLQAFARTFEATEAELLLKILPHPGLSGSQIQAVCAAELGCHARGRPPRVRVLDSVIPPGLVPGLFASADAFVLPSRGEGWGRPVHEAMLMGLPVVATRAGALETLLPDDRHGYPVRCRMVPVPEAAALEIPAFRGQTWFEPDLDDLCARLRQVFEDPGAARIRALHARRHVLGMCRRDRIAAALHGILRPLLQRTPALPTS